MEWNHAKDLLVLGFAGYLGVMIKEVVKSINHLNTQVAVVIADTRNTKYTVKEHGTRIHRLEKLK